MSEILLSNIFLALLLTIVSMVLHIADVREIGLYDCGLFGSLFGFNRGMMVASFHCSGSFPLSQDLFISLRIVKFLFRASV